MKSQYQEQYYWLQFIASLLLQEDPWPLEIPKEQAFAEIIKSAQEPEIIKEAQKQEIKLDFSNPKEFLANLYKIAGSLSLQPPEQPLGNLPPLEEIMVAYNEHLTEKRAKIEKTLFPSLDKQIEILYQRYHRSIQEQLAATIQNPYLAEEASRRIADRLVTQIPQTTQDKALGQKEYHEILESLRPVITHELKRVGAAQEPTIIISSLAERTLSEAQSLTVTPHFRAPIEAILATVKPAIEKPTTPLKLVGYPHLRWQPTGTGVSPVSWVKAASKKAAFAPSAIALRWLVHLTPDELQKKYPEWLLAANGFTPETAKGALRHVRPGSSEAEFWRGVLSIFGNQRSALVNVFKNYYELNGLGKFASRGPGAPGNLIVRVLSFGKIKTIPGMKTAFWSFLKKTRFGSFLGRQAGKLLARIGISKVVGVAIKTGAKGLLASLPEPVSKILLALSLLWGKIKGKFGGLFKKIGGFLAGFLPFKAKRATEKGVNTLEDAFGGALNRADSFFRGMATFSFPRVIFALPVAAVLILIFLSGFKLAFQEPRAFVGSWEEEIEAGSRYIQISKTAQHPSDSDRGIPNSALPFTVVYQIAITAKDSDLSDVRISDVITLYQDQDGDGEGEEREIKSLSWTIDDLPQNEDWVSPEYSLEVTSDFQDSSLSNQVIVKAASTASEEEETNQAFSTLIIGTPPILPNALLAQDIVSALSGSKCGNLVKIGYESRVTLASWSEARACLVKANLLNEPYILSVFETSINSDFAEPYRGNLQCVAFVFAVSQGDLPPPGGNGNAQEYCSGGFTGYTLSTDWDDLKPGDYVVTSSGDSGHIAVVTFRSGDIVWVAEAIGNTGLVQERRDVGHHIFTDPNFSYCGFLRRN